MNKEKIEKLARSLMFELTITDEVISEFDTIFNQFKMIEDYPGINTVEPLVFPFELTDITLREDVVTDALSTDELLKNTKSHYKDQVKVPKVVE